MEVLLALAGIAGIAALLSQSKALPSQADAEKALDKLDKNPADPDANTVAGKYKAFVMGDYAAAMPYLAQGSDKTLKALAEHEMDAGYTLKPTDKVVMGDEWVAAAKKFQVLSRIFYDRAAQWYIKAWPDLDGAWKGRSRVQGLTLATARPPGVAVKGLPTGWVADIGASGGRASTLDGTIARSGSYSVKMVAPDEKVKGSSSRLKSDIMPVSGKSLELSAYALTDGTESAADGIYLSFFDKAGTYISSSGAYIPMDLPFWGRVSSKIDVPQNIVRMELNLVRQSKRGGMWIDDISVKVDGKETLKNPSFEEK